jgi:hypothetical protein
MMRGELELLGNHESSSPQYLPLLIMDGLLNLGAWISMHHGWVCSDHLSSGTQCLIPIVISRYSVVDCKAARY